MENQVTTEPVQPGNFNHAVPEFGRQADVQRIYGLKRGTTYNLLNAGKIRGCLLRVKGRKSGVRLFDMASVREFIRAEMARAAGERHCTEPDQREMGRPPMPKLDRNAVNAQRK
jgi:hypothetical protein